LKIVCESCGHQGEAAAIRVDEGVPVFTCGSCGFENRADSGDAPAEPAAPAASEPAPVEPNPVPLGPGEIKCPKCFHRQPSAASHCVRCGLDLSRAAEFRHAFEPDPKGREEEYARALEMWDRLVQTPTDRGAHESFLSFCTQNGLLEMASRRYRERLSDYPDESPTDEFMSQVNQRMEALAVSMLSADTWSEDLTRNVTRIKRLLLIVAAILALVGVALAAWLISRPPSGGLGV